MKKNLLLAAMLFGASTLSYAQIVTISPANATGEDVITITLNANNACVPTGKLAVNSPTALSVNMHSGVGIVADINDPDGKWTNVKAWDEPGTILTPGATAGTFSITITPRSFYNVPANETIHRLSMVFNGGSWDFEAKNTTAVPTECADFFIELSTATSVSEKALEAVAVKTYPNPFTESTTISFTTQRNAKVKISAVNILGQEVATIANQQMEEGKHFIQWNGDSNSGQTLPNGQYFIQVSVDGAVSTSKVVLNR